MDTRSSSIELRHLYYFVAAAEHGSFRKAGTALGVRQSAISRRIRDLEDQIGVSLFLRHSGGVSLTYAGERFLRRTRQSLRAIHESTTNAKIVGRGEEGVIRIGINSSLASGFLSDLMRAYFKIYIGVQVDLIDGDPAEHISAIRQFRLDVAFIIGTSTWTDCETLPLWSERIFVVLPNEHRLVAKDKLDWADLAGENFIVSNVAPGPDVHDYLVRQLSDLGHHPDIQSQCVGRDNLIPLVALGRGLTLTSEATTGAQIPGVSYRPVVGETLPFSAVWLCKNDNPTLRRFISLARLMAPSSRAGVINSPASATRSPAEPARNSYQSR